MKTESNKFLTGLFSKKSLFLAVVMGIMAQTTSALGAQQLTLFGDTLDNKVTPNCYLRKEYNYFMNQWTTNEVCNPRVDQVAPKTVRLGNSNAGVEGNIYLGPTTGNTVYSAPAVYNNAPVVYNTVPNYSYTGFYTGNNAVYTGNSWNGYGSASNYLLGSFGGGIGSNGYFNNYYPNSLYTYLPTYTPSKSYWDLGYALGSIWRSSNKSSDGYVEVGENETYHGSDSKYDYFSAPDYSLNADNSYVYEGRNEIYQGSDFSYGNTDYAGSIGSDGLTND